MCALKLFGNLERTTINTQKRCHKFAEDLEDITPTVMAIEFSYTRPYTLSQRVPANMHKEDNDF